MINTYRVRVKLDDGDKPELDVRSDSKTGAIAVALGRWMARDSAISDAIQAGEWSSLKVDQLDDRGADEYCVQFFDGSKLLRGRNVLGWSETEAVLTACATIYSEDPARWESLVDIHTSTQNVFRVEVDKRES